MRLTRLGETHHDKILGVALDREKLLLSDISKEDLEVVIKVLLGLNKDLKQVNAFEPL
ncbi:hypothetical protein [Paraglaciecola sp. T6c]|uniref:hypothetical protein n=1 Tax=Pseudoalteromonas atlantica (strain T6c / ATCC BAA-1087) TaxID=3042615 RepID=UPI0002E77642|nr:hypothetical protein [Paraglaciecola sp. T6c]